MLITIELENAIDHLFRGEELLPSAEESLKEMDFESLAQGIKFFSKPVYVYTAFLTVILTADIVALCCFPSRPHSCIPRLMKK